MEEEKGGFYSELNSNHKQWLLCGVVGPPMTLIAWIASIMGSFKADGYAFWALAFTGLAAILLPIRGIVSLFDKDERRVTLAFFGLAVLNGALLYYLST